MDVSIVGSGYVGTTIAACLADFGHTVRNIDIDEDIVTTINNGESPIHEPGLDEKISAYAGDTLTATTDYASMHNSEVVFVALPTPAKPSGAIDTDPITTGVRSIGDTLNETNSPPLIVIKSTVIPGTTTETLIPLLESTSNHTVDDDLDVAVNPEFLREGTAVQDFITPDKLVFGTNTPHATDTLHELYTPLIESANPTVIETGRQEAEFIKYANNAFLATKISLINELGNIAKDHNVDAYEVANALGADHRISEHFLRSGVGYGGSCFPKDVAALIYAAKSKGYDPDLLTAGVEVNEKQPQRLLELLDEHGDIANKRITVLGLAFKPGTDDLRNSRAIPVIDGLQDRDANIVAYDPVANDALATEFPDIEYAASPIEALTDSYGTLVVTEWDEFAALDDEFNAMRRPLVIDGRHVITRRDGITYEGLTW